MKELLPGQIVRELTPRLRRYGRRQVARRLRALAADLDLMADPGPRWDREVLTGAERANLRKRAASLRDQAVKLERG